VLHVLVKLVAHLSKSHNMEFKTVGFEVEFFVPNEKLVAYSELFKNAQTDNYGLDSGNLNICEYRSNVSPSIPILKKEYETFKTNVKKYNPLFKPFFTRNTYGIHISFDKLNKWCIIFAFLKVFFVKHPLVCLYRMLLIDWFREHENRVEFRLIPTLENDNLFFSFLNEIDK